VVDDGSTDGSARLAESYGDGVRVIRQANNGAPAARNRGIREARGEYLSFLDADDLYRPDKLSAQLRVLLAEPALDLCTCTARNFWEPGLEQEQARYEAAGKVLITHHFATLLAHRSVFERVGPINETRRYADYVEWFHRASDLGLTTRVIPDVLLDRRMHAASLSHTRAGLDEYFELARARIERHRG
jgi:glycosyltransferase involved in cell wall biosynthesis